MAEPLPVWKEEYEAKAPVTLPVWQEPQPGAYERYVAQPLTQGAAALFRESRGENPAARKMLGVREPGVREPGPPPQAMSQGVAETAAKILVPQTALEAGAAVGTGAASRLLGPLYRAAPALARVLGGALGGEAGGQLSGEPTGAGLAVGGGGAVAGETVGAAGNKIVQALPWMKGAINRADAKRIGEAVGDISPPLAGAKTPKDFQGLVEDRGLPALGEAKERVAQRVEGMIPGNLPGTEGRPGPGPAPPWGARIDAGQIAVPSLGTPATPPARPKLPWEEALEPPRYVAEGGVTTAPARPDPGMAAKPLVMSVRDANAELSRIGDMLYGRRPLDPRYKDVDLAQLYGKLSEEIRQGIEQAGGPEARAAWEAGQQAYRKGRGVFDYLRDSRVMDANGMLDVPRLQRMLKNPETAAELKKALGPADFEKLAGAVFRGADRTQIDRMAIGAGGPFDALATIGRGQNTGAWSLPLALGRILFPNIGSQYVGKVPYSLPPGLQAILDVGMQKLGGAALNQNRP